MKTTDRTVQQFDCGDLVVVVFVDWDQAWLVDVVVVWPGLGVTLVHISHEQ